MTFTMKKLICILFFMFSWTVLFSQGIVELFYMLPDEFSLGINQENRKMLIRDSSLTTEEGEVMFRLVALDKKNGYLKLYVVGVQCDEWEMCYWSYGEAEKIVAVNKTVGCFYVLHFFRLYNGKLVYYFNPIMWEVNPNYLFKTTTKISDVTINTSCIIYDLPQKGVNIKCSLGMCDYDEQLLRGNKFDLIWDNGSFKLGKPYF